jgi:hypothetical protein
MCCVEERGGSLLVLRGPTCLIIICFTKANIFCLLLVCVTVTSLNQLQYPGNRFVTVVMKLKLKYFPKQQRQNDNNNNFLLFHQPTGLSSGINSISSIPVLCDPLE